MAVAYCSLFHFIVSFGAQYDDFYYVLWPTFLHTDQHRCVARILQWWGAVSGGLGRSPQPLEAKGCGGRAPNRCKILYFLVKKSEF